MILVLLLFIFSPVAAAELIPGGAYDVLESYGLPRGLLPKGVTEFNFSSSDGKFEARLASACTAKLDGEVHYDVDINGTIKFGEMAYLSGISAQELFLWFPIKGIRVDDPRSGIIYFDVGGLVRKQFALSLFETPPDCSPGPSPSREGRTIARIFSESNEDGKVRYAPSLDGEDHERIADAAAL